MIKIGDVLDGKISVNLNGSAHFTSPDLQKDIYLHKSKMNKAFHLDSVKIEVIAGQGRSIEGKVIEIIERFRTEFVGTISISDKFGFFIPDSNKLPIDFFIPLNKLNGATHGQKVVVELTDWKDDAKNPNGKVIRVIGNAGEHETEIHSIMSEFNLPDKFPYEVLEEAEAISGEITQDEIDKRLDCRDILTIGIDPQNSRDADDTLGLEWVDGVANIYVNIADISHYIKPNSLLDKEAYNRGTSVYLVDRVIHMIPERLSSNICSLKSGLDKLTFSAIFKIDNRGNIIDTKFVKSIINVNKDYTYEEAQDIIENGIGENKETDRMVLDLDRIAKLLRKNRLKDEFLKIDSPEVSFILDKNNKPIDIIVKISKDSNKLIEEFMLLTNREVSKFIKSKGLPSINRIHESPDINKLNQVKDFVKEFGYEFNINENENIRGSINKLLSESKDTSEGDIINNLITRAQQKAKYSPLNLSHFGLNFKDYSHFTSGIRRYSDIICHRLLTKALGNDGYPIKE
jgi:ribonuclease R